MQLTRLLTHVVQVSLPLYLSLLLSIGEAAGGRDPVPYLLFTTQQSIRKLYLNGSTNAQIISTPAPGFSLDKIDYHYRLGYMFWIVKDFNNLAQIVQSHLDGSDHTILATGDLVDLAVDWINDKLYWIDATETQIEEYDITSGVRRVVASTGTSEDSRPVAMALYPFPNYGWIYWSDSTSRTIEMVSVRGDSRSTFHRDVSCVTTMTVDYTSHTIYWIDQCTFQIQSLRLDADSSTHSLTLDPSIFFPTGLSVFQDVLYWTAWSGVFKANQSDDNPEMEVIFSTGSTRPTGLRVVHPSQQPSAETYVDIVIDVEDDFTFQCSGECVHGNCIPPGLCACDSGWRGDLCDLDIVECSEGNGGCEYTCINLVGGHECGCPDGFVLTDDLRTCVEECTSSVVTVMGSPPATTTFDPCLLYIRVTSTSSPLAVPTSTMSPTPSPSITTSAAYHTTSNAVPERVSLSSLVAPMTSSASIGVERTPVRDASSHPAPYITVEDKLVSEDELSSTSYAITPTTSLSSTVTEHKETPRENAATTIKIASTSNVVLPSPGLTDIVKESPSSDSSPFSLFGLSLYALIAIGGGAVLLIATIVFLVIICCLVIRYKRHRKRSWSPQKSFKANGVSEKHAVDSTSMKPVNGYHNGTTGCVSKRDEAELELGT